MFFNPFVATAQVMSAWMFFVASPMQVKPVWKATREGGPLDHRDKKKRG